MFGAYSRFYRQAKWNSQAETGSALLYFGPESRHYYG
jgi:hypothetical protein